MEAEEQQHWQAPQPSVQQVPVASTELFVHRGYVYVAWFMMIRAKETGSSSWLSIELSLVNCPQAHAHGTQVQTNTKGECVLEPESTLI